MLKRLLVLAVAMSALNAQAGEFDGGSPEYDERPNPVYSEAEVQRKIENDMQIVCKDGLCTIVSQEQKLKGWTVTFNTGYGSPNSGGSGNNFYIGDKAYQNQEAQGYVGVTITYRNQTCVSKLNVPPLVYRFINTYMGNGVTPEGSPKRNFSPADQTVILFFTTILNKVEGCGNNGGK